MKMRNLYKFCITLALLLIVFSFKSVFAEEAIIHNVPDTITVYAGDKFNKPSNITAKLGEDDLTSNIIIDSSKVDTSTPGEYPVTFSVTNKEQDKVLETKTSTVIVKDSITFNGIQDILITPEKYTSIGEHNNPYLQQELMDMAMDGVSAESIFDENIPVKAKWDKLSFNPGTYIVSYTVTRGSYTKQVQRTIHMYSESDRPKIKLSRNYIIVPYLAENFDIRDYVQVTGTDKIEGDVSKKVSAIKVDIFSDPLNIINSYSHMSEQEKNQYDKIQNIPQKLGSVSVSVWFWYTNKLNLTGATSVRVNVVKDIHAPKIYGVKNKTIKYGTTFDPIKGVSFKDDTSYLVEKTLKLSGKVNTKKLGKYTLTYQVHDGMNRTTTVKRIITVKDLTKPQITGIKTVKIKRYQKFNSLKNVKAIDNVDKNLTSKIKVSGKVNTKKKGTYTLTYTVSDKSKNKTIVKRKVIVK